MTAATESERIDTPPPNAISPFEQWVALTGRELAKLAQGGELILALIMPLVFTLGYYLPLKWIMGLQGINYAQYVMAVVILQTMAFTMMSAAQRASSDHGSGFGDRLMTLPIPTYVPFAARLTTGAVRLIVSFVAAVAWGHVIGFRIHGDWVQITQFIAFPLAFGLILIIGADALGSMSRSVASISQLLTLPILIFGMLSTGFIPESGFPEWIRPFVRNQPISHVAAAVRELAAGGTTAQVLVPAILWLGAMAAAFIPLAIWASGRRQ